MDNKTYKWMSIRPRKLTLLDPTLLEEKRLTAAPLFQHVLMSDGKTVTCLRKQAEQELVIAKRVLDQAPNEHRYCPPWTNLRETIECVESGLALPKHHSFQDKLDVALHMTDSQRQDHFEVMLASTQEMISHDPHRILVSVQPDAILLDQLGSTALIPFVLCNTPDSDIYVEHGASVLDVHVWFLGILLNKEVHLPVESLTSLVAFLRGRFRSNEFSSWTRNHVAPLYKNREALQILDSSEDDKYDCYVDQAVRAALQMCAYRLEAKIPAAQQYVFDVAIDGLIAEMKFVKSTAEDPDLNLEAIRKVRKARPLELTSAQRAHREARKKYLAALLVHKTETTEVSAPEPRRKSWWFW